MVSANQSLAPENQRHWQIDAVRSFSMGLGLIAGWNVAFGCAVLFDVSVHYQFFVMDPAFGQAIATLLLASIGAILTPLTSTVFLQTRGVRHTNCRTFLAAVYGSMPVGFALGLFRVALIWRT